MNRFYEVYDLLKNNNIETHFPGTKNGMCREPYVVIKGMGKYSTNGLTGSGLIHMLIYTPKNNYEGVHTFVNTVKDILKPLSNLKFTGNETPIIVEDEIDAFTTSIEYEYFRTI